MILKRIYLLKFKIKIKVIELVNFFFFCEKMILKRIYSLKFKIKIKVIELYIKNLFW